MKKIIAVVDDEPDIRELVSFHLNKNGYMSKEYEDATSFLRSLSSKRPDLILLDIMLPDMNGFEICKILKRNDKTANIPVIMLTARGEETDKVLGLELGADDYLTKPFSPAELIARINAIFRRLSVKEEKHLIKIEDLIEIDPANYEVKIQNKKIDLTLTEFKILEKLASNRGQVFSREQLIEYIWGEDKVVLERTIDVHIKNLRDKLGVAKKFLVNIRGLGYKLN